MTRLLIASLPAFFLLLSSPPGQQNVIKTKPAKTSVSNKFQLDDWLIDEPTAMRMVDNYRNCKGKKCRESKKRERNNTVEEEIKKQYTILSSQPMMARYGEEDSKRYRKARKLADSDGQGDVDGYTTIITQYKVISKTEALFPVITLYVDDYKICPPPENPPCQ